MGQSGDTYVAGGWSRSCTRPRNARDEGNSCYYEMQIAARRTTSNLFEDVGYVQWSEEWSGWQFAAVPVVIGFDYSDIRVRVIYRNSLNDAEFSNLFLHKEQFGRSYQYDAKGNVLSTKNLAALQSYATYDAFNNMLSYRQPGRPSGDSFTMTYGSTDAERKKHLVKTSKSPLDIHQEYTYDNKGNVLTQQTRNSTASTFIKGATAYTTDQNYAATQTDARGKTVSTVTDANKGTTVSVTDPNGQTVSCACDAWGKKLETTGELAGSLGYLNPFRYRGYVYDEETGLHYLRSRYYNPNWGRLLNEDAILSSGGALLNWNMFDYCGNNPIINQDPSGYTEVEEEVSWFDIFPDQNPQHESIPGIELMTKIDLKALFPKELYHADLTGGAIAMRYKLLQLIMVIMLLLLLPLAVFGEADCPADVPENTVIQFPDKNFEEAVRRIIDKQEGDILKSDVSAISELDVHRSNIADLRGIEHFTNLKTLYCYANKLTTLDVSHNHALTELACHENDLIDLNVGGASGLEYLTCSYNQLATLDVSKNKALVVLDVEVNQLRQLDIRQNTALEDLYCMGNQLTALDVSQNAALNDLFCDFNQLTGLDISRNMELFHLTCGGNRLTILDTSNNAKLWRLDCYDNEIITLDFSQNANLVAVNCNHNKLESIQLKGAILLNNLDCGYNRLTTLDVGANGHLDDLACNQNQLSMLCLDGASLLYGLDCSDNQLTTLDLSQNPALTELSCANNRLTTLDVSNNPALRYLACYNNLFPDKSAIIGLDESKLEEAFFYEKDS